jgi:cell division protein FtsB
MKKVLISITAIIAFTVTSCGGGGWESKVEEWCELEKKIESSKDDAEREKLKEEQDKIEEEVEKMIKDGDVSEDDVEKAAEACEN